MKVSQDIDDFIFLTNPDGKSSAPALLKRPQWIIGELKEAGVEGDLQSKQSIELLNCDAGPHERPMHIDNPYEIVRQGAAVALQDEGVQGTLISTMRHRPVQNGGVYSTVSNAAHQADLAALLVNLQEEDEFIFE